MLDAHRRERWNHTADLMALVANCMPGSPGNFTRETFHPLGADPELVTETPGEEGEVLGFEVAARLYRGGR